MSVARRAVELPAAVAALSRGEVTIDQVAVIARFVPAHNDAEVVPFATAATVAQLRSTLRKYRFDHPEPEPVIGRQGSEPDTGATIVDTVAGPVDIGDNYRCAYPNAPVT